VYIRALSQEPHEGDRAWDTKVIGEITLSAADSASERLVFGMEGVVLDGDINGASNWLLKLVHFMHDNGHTINRTHGTNGCRVLGSHFRSNGGGFQIIDSDFQANSHVEFEDSVISFGFTSNVCFDFQGAVAAVFRNCMFDCFSTTNNSIFDMQGLAASITFYDCFLFPYVNDGTTLSVAVNDGAGTVAWHNTTVEVSSTGVFDPSCNTVSGTLKIQSSTAPANPFAGLVWHDVDLYESLMWDGTYWITGG
jgi:hypothetical protein